MSGGGSAGPRRTSAGILLYRRSAVGLEVLVAHPGGPYFERRDAGAWTIPKGEPDGSPDLLAVALREFEEETGHAVAAVAANPEAPPIDLGSVVQKGGKQVVAWAVEGDLDPTAARSNMFEMAWPPGSAERHSFPEIDRVAWAAPGVARSRLNPAQAAFIDRLEAALGPDPP